MNAREIIKEIEELLKKHNVTLTADNMGEINVEIGNKLVAYGSTFDSERMYYLER